jgi:hypothetical protein
MKNAGAVNSPTMAAARRSWRHSMASDTFCWLMGVEKLCSSAYAMP